MSIVTPSLSPAAVNLVMQMFSEPSSVDMNGSYLTVGNRLERSPQVGITGNEAIEIFSPVITITCLVPEFIATNNKGFEGINHSDLFNNSLTSCISEISST